MPGLVFQQGKMLERNTALELLPSAFICGIKRLLCVYVCVCVTHNIFVQKVSRDIL